MSLSAYRKAWDDRDLKRWEQTDRKDRMLEKARDCKALLLKPLSISSRQHPQALDYLLRHQMEWQLWKKALKPPVLVIGSNVEWDEQERSELLDEFQYRSVAKSAVDRRFKAYYKQYRKFLRVENQLVAAIEKCNDAAVEFERSVGNAPVLVRDSKDFQLLLELRGQEHWKGNVIQVGDEIDGSEYDTMKNSAGSLGIDIIQPRKIISLQKP